MTQATYLNSDRFGTETKVGRVRECKLVVLLLTECLVGD